MDSKILLHAHIGYRSVIKITNGEQGFQCHPGDLHMLTLKNVQRMIRLLDCGAVSHTGMINRKGHPLESDVITIQNLAALQLSDGTVTSEDVRNVQSAKAKFAASVEALLCKSGARAEDVEVHIETIDGELKLDDAVRIGMIPNKMHPVTDPALDEQIEFEQIDLEEPAIIHAYTEHLFFPKA